MQPADRPTFPPLLHGEAAPQGADPFAKAVSAALTGTDPGLVLYQNEPHRLRVAVVFTPEAKLEDAMAAVFATALGFADALGALAPPEVGVHFDWPRDIRVNGARCGNLRAAASTSDPTEEPDWLVVSIDVPISPRPDEEPGADPERTWLSEEGCTEIEPVRLIESWSRHMLVWLNRWMDDGLAPLHSDWCSRAFNIGKEVVVKAKGVSRHGTFVGLDEKAGMLLREGEQTTLLPLTTMLEDA